MVISDVFRLRDDILARDFQAAVKSSGPEATARKVPAAVFLSRTFPTNDLVRLLKVVETKFTRREKELGVIVIRSGMGGGKSHLITALDVILSNPGAAQEWAQKWPQVEFTPPPMPVRVIVRSLTGLAQDKPNFLFAASILGNDGELEGRLVRGGANEVFLNDANDQIQVILFRWLDGWTPNSRKLAVVSNTVDGYSTLYESVAARSTCARKRKRFATRVWRSSKCPGRAGKTATRPAPPRCGCSSPRPRAMAGMALRTSKLEAPLVQWQGRQLA